MRPWLRFLGLVGLTSALAWLAMAPYHALLAPCVTASLGVFGYHFTVLRLDLLAPYDLAFFVALVLTTPAGPSDRLRAMLVGVPILVLVEITVATGMTASTLQADLGRPWPEALSAFAATLSGSFPWVVATLVWVWMLGMRVPGFAGSVDEKSRPRRRAA